MASPELRNVTIDLSGSGATSTPTLNSVTIEAFANESAPFTPAGSPELQNLTIDINSDQPVASPVLFEITLDAYREPLPPEITLDNPTSGIMSGSVLLQATATDPNLAGISSVEFLVDGLVVDTDVSSPYEFTLNTALYSDTTHNIQARATNIDGLSTTTPDLYLQFDNSAPSITLDAPSIGYQTGSITISATAIDPHSGITLVEFLVNGGVVGSSVLAPYSISYDTNLVPDGPVDFSARATNGVGIIGYSSTVTLTVDNSPPPISALLPLSGPVHGTILLEASSVDPHSGTAQVEFFVNGNSVGIDTTNTFAIAFDTTTLSNGIYDFEYIATNNAGLTGSTGAFQIEIDNGVFPVLPSYLQPPCPGFSGTSGENAVRAEYIYRVLTSFLNLIPDEDREFLSRYWGGLQQMTEDFYLQAYQNDLSKNLFTVPVFRRSRWNEIILHNDATRATIMSTRARENFDTSVDSGFNTITIMVDGTPVSVTFTNTPVNDVVNIALEINAHVKNVFIGEEFGIATVEDGRLVLKSLSYGSGSHIKISEADYNTSLGFYPGVEAYGTGLSTRAEPAQLYGSISSPIFDTSITNGTNSISLKINGGQAIEIAFNDDGTSTITHVKNTINTYIPGLATISTDNKIILTSNITGPNSVIEVISGNSSLGFTSGDIRYGNGQEYSDPDPERPVSFEVIVGTSDDDLNLVPISDPAIVSIPALRDRIDYPSIVFGQANRPHIGDPVPESNYGTNIGDDADLREGAYKIKDGRLHFTKEIDAIIKGSCLSALWAEDVYRNDTYLKDNFGFPIQVERNNSIAYKNVLQGMHQSYWTGPNVKNTEIGLNLLFGLPTAPITGKIDEINVLSSPEIIGEEASDTFDIRGNNRTFSFTIDGTFVFAIFDPSNIYPETGPSVSHENYPASLIRDDINIAAAAASLPFPNPATLIQPQAGIYQVKLSGLNSVRIDTITGNAAIGFKPGDISFGENEIVISGESYPISTEFPITKQAGDVVERLDPLTDGVEVLHYITDPLWWEVFGLASLDSNFSISNGYSSDDLKLINDILKYHIFGVKIVPDAFTRLGDVGLDIVSKFINDIKPLTKNFLFIIPFMLLDVFSLTDDPGLDGSPDINMLIKLEFPHNMGFSNWNQIGTNESAPAPTTSFSAQNDNVTRDDLNDGTFAGNLSGFLLDLEDVYTSSFGSAYVTDSSSFGASPQRYSPAIYSSDVAGPYNTSLMVGPFDFDVNGVSVSVSVGSNADEIPIGASVHAAEISEAINNKLNSLVLTGSPTAAFSIDGKLRIISHRFDGVTPNINIASTYPEIGITSTPGSIDGTPGILIDSFSI